ncbi:MAG: hypothetical protein ACP5IN_06450 [Caldimicrobium sp.]
MFLPSINFSEVKRAVLFSPIPEWNYFSKGFPSLKITNWLNINFRELKKGILICGPLLSSPILAILMETLKEKGLKEILFIGWAGKNPYGDLEVGELFIPQKAYSLEGTSKFYYKKKKVFTPQKDFFFKIKKTLTNYEIPFKTGNILTVDVPHIVEKKLKEFKLFFKKAQAMDMETSALYAISFYYNIKALSLLFITDEIGKTFSFRPESKLKLLREKLLSFLRDFIEEKI